MWLALALAYTHRQAWLTRRRITALSLVPLITLALLWANTAHGLIWAALASARPFTSRCPRVTRR